MLGIYELNQVDLLKEVFIWTYERSAARYSAVRQSLGEPDPFKFRHRVALREVIAEIVRGRMARRRALSFLAAWAQKNIAASDHDKFREVVEDELLSLHEGNFVRYQIKPSEFEAWQKSWKEHH